MGNGRLCGTVLHEPVEVLHWCQLFQQGLAAIGLTLAQFRGGVGVGFLVRFPLLELNGRLFRLRFQFGNARLALVGQCLPLQLVLQLLVRRLL